MKVTSVYFITREDGSEYTKTIFDTKHFAVLNNGESHFQVLTPNNRKASDNISFQAIKAINSYYDQMETA